MFDRPSNSVNLCLPVRRYSQCIRTYVLREILNTEWYNIPS